MRFLNRITNEIQMQVIAASLHPVANSVGAKGDFGHADGCVWSARYDFLLVFCCVLW